MNKVKIYALIDNSKNDIRYIGKTKNSLTKRLIQHKSISKYKKNHKECWMNDLIQKNIGIDILLIDEVEEEKWEFWEKYWICQFKAWGFDLVNATDGGITPFSTLKIRRKYYKEKNKEVIQYDFDGNFLKKWDSITQASNGNNVLRGHISRSCKNHKSSGGYMWRYYKTNYSEKIDKYVIKRDLSGLKIGVEMSKKFTKDEIKYIRNLYFNKEKTQIEISKYFNVSKISIWNIINYKTYKNEN